MSHEPDISVIVTAHGETLVSGPTMQSADLAVAAARARGLTVETIIALDRATPGCAAYFNQPAFDHWTRVEIDEGDLGRTRNRMMQIATGRNIAYLDADDLFSENWLAEGGALLVEAEARGDRIIVHPELNWVFEGATAVFAKPEQDGPIFDPYYLYFVNCYDSLCLTPREAHLEVPYVARDIPKGLSFQDWQFGAESMAAGWRHVIAKDTIIFKRRRANSLVTESRDRRAIIRRLPCMAIDRIADLPRGSGL